VPARRLTTCLLLLACAAPLAAAPPEAVTILRDRWGVPHLFAAGRHARERNAFANGWAQAEDRLFQMDLLRRAATGRLAEMLGPDYLLMDQVARRDGFTRAEHERFFRRLSLGDRRDLEAYRDGVNAWIARATLDPRLLPFEFLGVPPVPWDTTDSVAVAVLQFRVFGANGGREVLNADLLLDLLDRFPESEARGVFDDLLWIEDPAAPTTIPAGERTPRDPDRVERFAPAQMALLRAHADAIRRAAASLRQESGLLAGLGGGLGLPVGGQRHASNAVLIAPSFSATGAPILLGGPQVALNAPNFVWEVGLHGGGYEAEGVIAPAGPGVLIGRFHDFAMTITSGIMDNVDTFVETIDPAHPDRYLFRGRSRPFERRAETFAVAGGPDVTTEVLRTVHGPVFFVDRAAGVAFSRRAAFSGRELATGAAILRLGMAHDLRQFRRLADRVAMSLNLHYADAAGNIAWFHRGIRPVRPRRTDPRLPLDGGGGMEWERLLPPRRLPAVVNPRQGWLTNWNNKPARGWSAGEQRELWGVLDRVQVFGDALAAARAAGRKLGVQDVKDLMAHAATADVFAAHFVPFLEDAVAGRQPALVEAAAHVRAWVDAGAPLVADQSGVVPYPGAAIYRAWRAAAQEAVLGDELGSALRTMDYPAVLEGDQEDDHGSLGSPDALFLRILFAAGPVPGATPPPGLLPVSRDWLVDVTTGTPHSRQDALAGALATAVAALAARFGTADQSRWLLPALRETYRDLGLLSTFYGPTEQARQNRGSFNLVMDLGRPIAGEIIVPPGESGTFTAADLRAEPPHLRDQLPVYEAFAYRRQPFTADELEPPVTVETGPYPR
jgi:penicillin amidase